MARKTANPKRKKKLLSILHASELYTGTGFRVKNGRRVNEGDLGLIPDGAVVYEAGPSGRIVWVGATEALPREYKRIHSTDLKKRRAVTAGWVDCHTHLVFAGNRSHEFARRCTGATYEEIAREGGGILSTVHATRIASLKELEATAIERVEEARRFGVRTLEIKSGYGLDHGTELKCLEVVKRLKKKFTDMTFQATFLGAHAFPSPTEKSREAYLREILEGMLPEVVRKKLADACDVFVDDGYFTVREASEILKKARSLGLKIKIHADELGDTGSAALAADLGALSADHLLRISEKGIQALARSETVAVLLPATAFYLKATYAPARRLIDAGVAVAISTDFNPGSSMCNSLPAVMTLSALYMGMSRSEILAAVTYNAAKALGLGARKGTLEPGMDADFTILPFATFEESYYRFAWAPPPLPM